MYVYALCVIYIKIFKSYMMIFNFVSHHFLTLQIKYKSALKLKGNM